MGYMDISIVGSDSAADCHYGAARTLVDYYESCMADRRHDNSYNTPTSMNIALSFNVVGKEFWLEASFLFEDNNFLDDLNKMLEDDMKTTRVYHKEEASSNSKWHLTEFGKIVRKFRNIKKAILEE